MTSMTGLKQILPSSSCLGPPAAKHSSRPASCTPQWLTSREAESKLLSNSCLSEAGFGPEAGRFVCFKSYLTMDVFIIHIHVTLLSALRRTGRKAFALLSPSVEQTALISHVLVAFQSLLAVALTLLNKTKGSGGAVCFLCTLQPFINFSFNTMTLYWTLVLYLSPQTTSSHDPKPLALN